MLGKDREKHLAKLRSAKGRREQGRLLLDSQPLIFEALNLGLVEELLVSEPGPLVEQARRQGIYCTEVRPDQLQRIADTKSPPGLLALAQEPLGPERSSFREGPLRVLFLERLADPGNIGTIARSALAFGVDLIVLAPGCADPLAPKTLRASAGALLRLPFLVAELDDPRLAELRSSCQIYRSIVQGGAPLHRIEIAERAILWVGNEARGASLPDALDGVQDLSIPMPGPAESLNVAAATAVLLYAASPAVATRR